MEPQDIAARLEDITGGEVWEIVKEFTVYRRRKTDDEHQEVSVKITWNDGVGYMLTAADEYRNLRATGNPHRDLGVVLATVHWQQLDAEKQKALPGL